MGSSNWSSVEAFFKFLSNSSSSIYVLQSASLHSRIWSAGREDFNLVINRLRLRRVPRSAVCYSTLIQSDSQWVLGCTMGRRKCRGHRCGLCLLRLLSAPVQFLLYRAGLGGVDDEVGFERLQLYRVTR